MGSELINTIPTVDLSPFFQSGDNESGKGKAKEITTHACRTYGFLRIVSHGVPITLMKRAIDLSKTFFHRPYEDELKSCPVPESNAPLPTGYMRQPEISGNKNEYVLMFKPELGFNIYPAEPTEFRSTLDECFSQMSRTALLVERILTECMGLRPNFIKDYDEARNTDFMLALRYFAVTMGDESSGLAEHQDGSCSSFVFQDDVGGLVVFTDGKWISAEPSDDSIVVNIGDILQVLTNNTFISATRRVLRKEKDRYSYAFFFNANEEKWIEPLPQFTSDIGVSPEYKGFRYKDYLQLRMKNISLPPEDFFDISSYAISHISWD